MRLQLQIAEDLGKLVTFSKLKWRVSIYHFTVVVVVFFFALCFSFFSCFFAQIAVPCWQRHKAPKAWVLARLLENLLIP